MTAGSQRDTERDGAVRLYAQLGVRLPANLALQLRNFCRASRQSLNTTVVHALDEYLAARSRDAASRS
jgi:hypothetical protein